MTVHTVVSRSALTLGERKRAWTLWKQGQTVQQIAAALDASEGCVNAATKGREDEAVCLYRGQRVLTTVARAVKMSVHDVAWCLDKQGVDHTPLVRAKAKARAPRAKAAEPVVTATKPVPLVDLADNGCRYPVSDDRPFLFCNATAQMRTNHAGEPVRDSYCAVHAKICRIKTPPMRKDFKQAA